MRALLILAVAMLAGTVYAQDEPIDYNDFDTAVLVIMADNLQVKLGELDARLAHAQEHVGSEEASAAEGEQDAAQEEPLDDVAAIEARVAAAKEQETKVSPHAGMDKDAWWRVAKNWRH